MLRRDFLKSLAMLPALSMVSTASGLLIPSNAIASPPGTDADFWDRPRVLNLYRAQTRETVSVTYFQDGQLVMDGYAKACHMLRDVLANKTVQMDVALLDLFRGVTGYVSAMGIDPWIIINSGYRSAATNRKYLSEGASRNSLHMRAQAADIKIPRLSTEYLARLGLYFRGGGVGFYPHKGFVHLDRGRSRFWRG